MQQVFEYDLCEILYQAWHHRLRVQNRFLFFG